MSTFAWATPLYQDQDLTVIGRTSIPTTTSPIPSEFLSSGTSGSNWNSPSYLFTEDCVQMLASWSPGVLNSLHPDFSTRNAGYSGLNFFLVAEGPRQDLGGGLVRWQRTYGAVPATHSEPESFAYSFIGFVGVNYVSGGSLGVQVSGRPRKNIVVTSRVKHEYFLVGLTNSTEAASQPTPQAVADYDASADIPSVYALRYFSTSAAGAGLFTDVDAITDPLAIAGGGVMTTSPSRTDYNTWMANAATGNTYHNGPDHSYAVGDLVNYLGQIYICVSAISVPTDSTDPTHTAFWSLATHAGWNSDVISSTQWKGPWLGNSNLVTYALGDQVIYLGVVYQCVHTNGALANDFPNTPGSTVWSVIHPGQFVAEDSRLTRWQGNIFLRQTRYLLAR